MSSIYSFFAGSHSATSALIVDGEIKYVIEEERLDRIKSGDNHESFPYLSSSKIEKLSGLQIKDSDYRIFVEPVPDLYADELTKGNYERVSHHDSHCYGSYFTSGMEGKVMTISYDGGGDKSMMKIYLCEDGKVTLLRSMDYPTFGSISHLWGFSTTGILGFDETGKSVWKICKDEGKLMGMAADGYYDENITRMLKSVIKYNNLKFSPSATAERTRFLMDSLRLQGAFDTKEQREVFSYNLQHYTNEMFVEFLTDLNNLYPEYRKFAFSGGLFANVKLNQKINELDFVDEIFIYPPMGDEGLPLGACIKKAVELGEITKPIKLKNVFFGIEYTNEEVDNINLTYKFHKSPYIPEETAKDLENGKIIGWFQGRFEHGPRALGARSILVKPTEIGAHKLLNERLKRYEIMPFAPIVMEEHFDKIFYPSKSKYSSEFMTICYSTRESWINKIPAVIQKSDKTARPQIVVKNKNPKFWEILNAYHKISGIPVLLNTSFNSHNEPIIDSPNQAFDTLKNGIIDKLIIGDYVYHRK
jgi:carbamoyltransferase